MPDETIRENRLKSILKKWTDAAPLSFFKTIPKQDLLDSGIPPEDLESHGLISVSIGERDVPYQVGKRELARILTKLFGNGKEIYPEQITRAVKDDGMLGWNTKKSNFITAQAVQWWRDNKSKTESQIAAAAEAEAKRKIVALQIAEMDLEERKREIDARWIMKEDAATTIVAAVLEHHATVKKQFGKKFSSIVARHLAGDWTEEQLSKINQATIEAGRELMKAIEDDCATA